MFTITTYWDDSSKFRSLSKIMSKNLRFGVKVQVSVVAMAAVTLTCHIWAMENKKLDPHDFPWNHGNPRGIPAMPPPKEIPGLIKGLLTIGSLSEAGY